MRNVLIASALILSAVAGVAYAQYPDRDDRRVPDLFGWLDQNRQGRNLSCTSRQRVDRRGDIVWLRLECQAR